MQSAPSLFSLKGKTVILTGATGYLGSYFAAALAESGTDLILIGRDEDKLSALAKKLSHGSTKPSYYAVDQYDHACAKATYEEIIAKHRVNVLINNAFDFSTKTGFNDPSGKLDVATYEQLKNAFDSGVYWAIQSTQVFGYDMKKRGGGAIVNIGTMYAVVVPAPDLYEGTSIFNPPGYSMAKAGLMQFTKYSASLLSPEVRVNALSPGSIPNVEFATANATTADNPVLKRLTAKILLKRVGHPRDLVGALLFLASDASEYVTGQNIVVDGGLTVT